MHITIAHTELTQNLADFLRQRLTGIRFAYSTIYLHEDRPPCFFNHSGVLTDVKFRPAYDDIVKDEEGNEHAFHYTDALYFVITEDGDDRPNTPMHWFAADNREPSKTTTLYFANGDVVDWIHW